ncbi:MAG TPA: hypothetical protein PKO15_05700 [Fibrobacteria bacterium]|nr:hypothetical protein [Fibrobacteria bacterium]HOX51414.1 hypothetical protein [Fibrobacteria bacterium]
MAIALFSGSLAMAGAGGKFLPIPVLFTTPETGPGGGAKLRWQDPLDKPGFADLTAYGTVRSQWNADAEFLRDSLWGTWRMGVFVEVGEFSSKWFGLGNPPADDMETRYTPEYLGGEVSLGRWLGNGWLAGARLLVEDRRVRVSDAGAFRAFSWTGQEGGMENNLGLDLMYEGRDLPENPRAGWFAKVSANRGLPSGDFRWQNLSADGSLTRSVGSLTGVGRFHHEEAWGGVPLWRVPALGYKKILRGLPDRRLRGQAVQCIGAEGRWNGPRLWKFPIQPAVFLEGGRAGEHDRVWSEEPNAAGGVGMRLPLAGGKAVLRADYGWSFYGSGLYVDFGQAF